MDDRIIIEFPPDQEGMTWIKRKTQGIKPKINNTDKNNNSKDQGVSVRKTLQMNEEFKRYISEINLRIDKYKTSHSSQIFKQLNDDYEILCVNFEHLGKPQIMLTCIKNIRAILRGETKKLEKRKKQYEQKTVEMSDRGIQIQERLSEEKINIQFLNDNIQNGQTQRGIEIQKELANLRDEVKRKDLNPIEKENLTNALIKLKKEITLEIDKFSKYDSIPIRLDQIENYLDKLKDKEEHIKKVPVSISKENEEIEKKDNSKKQKKQVIWKFGL